jgi:hypothetical protein
MKGKRTGTPRKMFMSYAGAGGQASIYGGQIASIFDRLLDRAGYRIDHRAGPFVVIPKSAASLKHGT